MKWLQGFNGSTGNIDYITEEFFGGEYGTSVIEQLGEESGLSISDYKVSASEVDYTFTIDTNLNPFPEGTKVYVVWPSTWALDCTNLPYTIECIEGCAMTLEDSGNIICS